MQNVLTMSDEVLARVVQVFQEAILMNTDCTELLRGIKMREALGGDLVLDEAYVVEVKNRYAEMIANKGFLGDLLRSCFSLVSLCSDILDRDSLLRREAHSLLVQKMQIQVAFILASILSFVFANVVHTFIVDEKKKDIASCTSFAASALMFFTDAAIFGVTMVGHTANVLSLCFSCFGALCLYLSNVHYEKIWGK